MFRVLSPAGDDEFQVSANSKLLREAEREWEQWSKDQRDFLRRQHLLRKQKKQQQNNA
jgi:hypothetical protein